MKVNIRRFVGEGGTKNDVPQITPKGDWINLYTNERVQMHYGEYYEIGLGVAVELPKGFEAVCVPRSSTFKKWKILMANSQGVIDNSYNGDADEWKFPAFAMWDVDIPAGTRIAQFRIQLSQKATFWQKIKWLFSNSVAIRDVAILSNMDRGGIGSTGD